MTVKIVGVLDDSYVSRDGRRIEQREVFYIAETKAKGMTGVKAGNLRPRNDLCEITEVRVGDLYQLETGEKYGKCVITEFWPIESELPFKPEAAPPVSKPKGA